jgi:1,2-diacylglycerol 3-beta-galactosyltransferase
MSDTGGGHRAASRAIEAALNQRYPGQFTCELVDVWKDYTPYPLNRAPQSYTPWVNNAPASYSAQFWVMNRILFTNRRFNALYNRFSFPRALRVLREHPADIIVGVHSAFIRGVAHTMRKINWDKPFITVISDWALPPIMWYSPLVDKCLVPTQPAYALGLRLGMQPDQMVLTGAPVHPKFAQTKLTKAQARAELGWAQDVPAVLMVGGGDGMGPLVKTAKAIDDCTTRHQLVVVAGRNQHLKKLLETHTWAHPTQVYGFVNNMQVLMAAADVLVTKAGPATITESAIMGLPLIMSGAIKYQESPNVDYVLEHRAGVYAPGPRRVARAIQTLLSDDGAQLRDMATRIKNIAEPDSIWKIADEIKKFG